MVGTHTYFPLSLETILILTNLSWVRNPYQNERKVRPNPDYLRDTVFNFTDIQTYRSLSEREVLEINYITKQRALRYIASAEREWLYPEKHLDSTHWSKFGDGLLLMPEPREVHMGGEIFVGYGNGKAESWNEYGQRPWDAGYKDEKRDTKESEALERFKAEWAVRQGREYRGTSSQFHRKLEGPYVVSEEYHKHDLERAKRYKR